MSRRPRVFLGAISGVLCSGVFRLLCKPDAYLRAPFGQDQPHLSNLLGWEAIVEKAPLYRPDRAVDVFFDHHFRACKWDVSLVPNKMDFLFLTVLPVLFCNSVFVVAVVLLIYR